MKWQPGKEGEWESKSPRKREEEKRAPADRVRKSWLGIEGSASERRG
jgi:hypothetical protein